MNAGTQRLSVWVGGLVFLVLFFVGFGVIAGFIPPPSPSDSAHDVATMFAENRTRIRIGLWITAYSSALLACFFAVITVQMRRIEGARTPLATVQAMSGALSVFEFIFPVLIWQTAAYRGDRPDTEIRLLNDLAWLPLLGIVGSYAVQCFAIAIVTLRDAGEHPLFPRWVAYLNVWVVAGVTPGSLVVFFHDGPLAWNGILAFWVLMASFVIWIAGMSVALLRAIDREERAMNQEETAVPGSPGG